MTEATASAGVVSQELRDQIFTVTRSTAFTEPEKRNELCRLIHVNGNPSMKEIVHDFIASDRTGRREVIGQLCNLSGYSTSDLKIDQKDAEKIHPFGGHVTNLVRRDIWDEKMKSMAQETEPTEALQPA